MIQVIKTATIIIPVLISVAYMTLGERKVMGGIQRRKGPTVVGQVGILQPIADGVKLIIKERVEPRQAGQGYKIGPVWVLGINLIVWGVIPMGKGVNIVEMEYGIIMMIAISGMGVYGIIIGGYTSRSRYAIMGGIRSTAQIISYEIAIGIMIINVVIVNDSYNMTKIVMAQKYIWNIIVMMPISIMWMICIIAETNRPPFDMAEAEGELVAGFNIEYGGIGFAMYYIAEYSGVIMMSTITSILYLGGYEDIGLGIKTSIVIMGFIIVRSTYPRYRYDKLMTIGWKKIIPTSLASVIWYASII